MTDTGNFEKFENSAHRVDVRFEQFEVNIFMSCEGIGFFEFGVELESDFIIVQSVAFDVL